MDLSPPPATIRSAPSSWVARLSVWDAASIIVGIVVGTAIFRASPDVFRNVSTPWEGLGIWLIGGFLSFMGALCYAELGTAFPRMGGDYEYLARAYGRWVGFLFGWAQLAAILTGSIGAMAYAFADYALQVFRLDSVAGVWLASCAIALLTAINCAGIVLGKTVQNLLTSLKLVSLGCLAAAGLAFGDPGQFAPGQSLPVEGPGFGLALVFVLYAFGGWNDAAFVAAEVRHRERNLPLALFCGLGLITVLYLAVNAAYLAVIGFEGVRETDTPAATVLEKALGVEAGRAISLMVMLSALGAINGMILAGARIYAVLGEDYPTLRWLSRGDPEKGCPLSALLAQAAVSLLLVLAVGTAGGRQLLDRALERVAVGPIPWEQYGGGFSTLVAATAPVFWVFFLLTGLSVFVLRFRYPQQPRPFRIPFYPVPVLIFCASCTYMLYASLAYARYLSVIGLLPLAAGLPLLGYELWCVRKRAQTSA
jgi:APA family basic amino acid/polyamine antiporter